MTSGSAPGIGSLDKRYAKTTAIETITDDAASGTAATAWTLASATRTAHVTVESSFPTTTAARRVRLELRDENDAVIIGVGGSSMDPGVIVVGKQQDGGVTPPNVACEGSLSFYLPPGWEFRLVPDTATTHSHRWFWVLL